MSPFVPGAVAAAGANGSSGNSTRHPISRRDQARASGPRIPDRTSNDRFMATLPRRDDGPHRSRLSGCGGLNSADASDLVSEISPTRLVAGARRRNAAIHSLPVGRTVAGHNARSALSIVALAVALQVQMGFAG